jgi:hypothetical protein
LKEGKIERTGERQIESKEETRKETERRKKKFEIGWKIEKRKKGGKMKRRN